MKALAAMMVLIGLCFLAQPFSAQSVYMKKMYPRNVHCEFVGTGKFVDLDPPGCISGQEGTLEELFYGVEDLKSNLSADEQLAALHSTAVQHDPDHLHDRIKELEMELNSQGTLLDKQQQHIEDLQKQIDAMRAELVKKPRPAAKKTQAGNSN
jgi:peptidoglycan hydrolase CwlO-like protein